MADFDIDAAKAEGYSDQEINAFLASSPGTRPVTSTFMGGVGTNVEPKGLRAEVGRMAPSVFGGALGAFAGAPGLPVAGPVATGAVGAGAGEAARQAYVAMRTGASNPLRPMEMVGEAAMGQVAFAPVAKVAGIGMDLGERAVRSSLSIPLQSMDRMKERGASAVLRFAEDAERTIPPIAKRIRDIVGNFIDGASARYGQVEQQFVQRYGTREIIVRKQLVNEMKEKIKASAFDPKSKADRSALREVGRLISDAGKPFSGDAKGAIRMSKRFGRELEFKAGAGPDWKGTDSYQRLIRELKTVWDSHLDRIDPKFGAARKGYADAMRLVDETKTYLNSKSMAGMTGTAERTGNLDLEIIDKVQKTVPRTTKSFNDLQDAWAGKDFARPASKAVGEAYKWVGAPAAAVVPPASRGVAGGAASRVIKEQYE